MKNILFILVGVLIAISTYSQSPQAFKYQAVVRDNAGLLLSNQEVNFQIDILKGTIDASSVYSETHVATTNTVGLVNLEIGKGTSTDDFSSIEWEVESHFIKVWVNGNEMGTTQLLSVPYALHARTAGKANTFDVLLVKGDTPCNAESKGAMRYNESTNFVEFCNGSNWVVLSSGLSVELAQLATMSAREVSTNQAVSGGVIISNGGAEIFEKGICWNISGTPTLSDNMAQGGSGSEAYTNYMGDLSSNETYYVRAYGKNTVGTAYGYEQFFTTFANIPETKTAVYISNTSFSSGGGVDVGGNKPVFDKGIAYSINPNPTESDNTASAGGGTGEFSVTVEDLEDETYYYKAYAYNDAGYNYGPEKVYRNHVVNADNISIIPSTVKFSNSYSDSYNSPVTSADDGKGNTESLVNKYGADAVAAYVCDTLTANGYLDWFLPSIEELNRVYLNKDGIGISNMDQYYWSSTVSTYDQSTAQEFNEGQQQNLDMTTEHYVICIRRKE